MGTKFGGFVSIMRNAIINTSIEMTIIEGAFEKGAEYSAPSELIIGKLVALL